MLRILRLPAVLDANGCGKSKFYNLIAQGLWTKPIKLSKRASGWPEYESDALNAARIAGKSDEEIRHLVEHLHAARTADNEARQ